MLLNLEKDPIHLEEKKVGNLQIKGKPATVKQKSFINK